MSSRDRRRHPRQLVAFPCVVTPSGGASVPTHLVELSQGGALLACVGLSGAIRVTFRGAAGPLELSGRVVRQDPGRTAIQFVAMSERDGRQLAHLLSPRPVAA